MLLPFQNIPKGNALMANCQRFSPKMSSIAHHSAKTPLGGRCRTRMSTLGYIRPRQTRIWKCIKVPHLQIVRVSMKTGWLWWLTTNCVHGKTWLKSAASVEMWVDVFFLYFSQKLIDGYLRPAWIKHWLFRSYGHERNCPQNEVPQNSNSHDVSVCFYRNLLNWFELPPKNGHPEICPISAQWPNCHHPAAEPSGQHPVQQNPQDGNGGKPNPPKAAPGLGLQQFILFWENPCHIFIVIDLHHSWCGKWKFLNGGYI